MCNKEFLELIKTITSCLALIGVIIAIFQVRINRKNLSLTSFKSIYDDTIKVRKKFESAKTQREILVGILKTYNARTQDMTSIYASDNYSELREIGYHYEYIGILVKEKLLPIDIVFELILFPDRFWSESQEFITLMRENHYSDFWTNFEYLKGFYIKKRLQAEKKNRR